jgi:hypothetical protein
LDDVSVMIILTILLAIAIIIVVTRMAWTYHRGQVNRVNARARDAQAAAHILAEHIETIVGTRDSAIYARDFYRAALNDIISCTDSSDPAGQIARRFINYGTTSAES